MMIIKPREYFSNFEPVEAMQWTAVTCNAFRQWMNIEGTCEESGWDHNAKDTLFVVDVEKDISLEDRQWLIKHADGSLTVQNEEPDWVEEWEWIGMLIGSSPRRNIQAIREFPARRMAIENPDTYYLMKRPVVRTGPGKFDLWTGFWEEVVA